MICLSSGADRGSSSSSDGGGDGDGEGGNGGGNRDNPPTLPHTDGDEGKVDQHCFNGGKNMSLKLWMKGSNRKRYQVHSKEYASRERLRRRTANTAHHVEYERRLGKLSPLWIKWVDARVKTMTIDGQTV